MNNSIIMNRCTCLNCKIKYVVNKNHTNAYIDYQTDSSCCVFFFFFPIISHTEARKQNIYLSKLQQGKSYSEKGIICKLNVSEVY